MVPHRMHAWVWAGTRQSGRWWSAGDYDSTGLAAEAGGNLADLLGQPKSHVVLEANGKPPPCAPGCRTCVVAGPHKGTCLEHG